MAIEEGRIASDFGSTLAVLSSAIGLNGFFGGPDGSKKALIMLDNDRSRRIAVYLSGDSKSSERKLMRVQVPPPAPHFSVGKQPCFFTSSVAAAFPTGISLAH